MLLRSYLILFVVSSGMSNNNYDYERSFPYIFADRLEHSEKFGSESQDRNMSRQYNFRKETTLADQTEYLKGHSLRIPNYKLTENGTSRNMLQIEREIRAKRGVAHLYNMISCATGCNPLSYKGYGCFCGLLGSGYPVDGIDRCCKMHDWCYDAAKCPTYFEYFVPYYWKCLYKRPFCALDHGELGAPGSCADKLCECDRALSECLRRYSCPTRRAFCKSSPFRFLQNAFMLIT